MCCVAVACHGAPARDAHFAMADQPNDTHQRRQVYYSGRVQGVGFRYTTRDIAARFDVAGFVENLRDGRVLVVVEGAPSTLDRFLATLESHMARYIQTTDTTTLPATHEFDYFEIRH